jgi:hypothetical protein
VDGMYLSRFLALVSSMAPLRNGDAIKVLALDKDSEDFFRTHPIPGVEMITLVEFESSFPELLAAKKTRTKMEYVFTLTPFLIKYCLDKSVVDSLVTYLDADLYFFDSPQKVVDKLGTASIGFMPHRFNVRIIETLKKFGIYNVGWVGIRNSENGRECVEWWANRCLEWCLDLPEDGKYADQGYLNQFPKLFRGVKVLDDKGFNLAPWNTSGERLSLDVHGNILINDRTQLVFFHFQGLRKLGQWAVTSQLVYRAPASNELIELVYKPYLSSLKRADELLSKYSIGKSKPNLSRGRGFRKIARNLLSRVVSIASVLTGNAVYTSKLKSAPLHLIESVN